MSVESVLTCPLGSKCEEIRDNKLHRCAWFIQLAGMNPSTGEQINERGCAMSWVPLLLVENSQQQRRTSSAVDAFKNEMVSAQQAVIGAAVASGALAAAGQRPAIDVTPTTSKGLPQ